MLTALLVPLLLQGLPAPATAPVAALAPESPGGDPGRVPEVVSFFGAEGGERIQGVWVDTERGQVFAGGDTRSDLALKYPPGQFPGFDQLHDGVLPDGFVARFSEDLRRLEAWTYLGGALGSTPAAAPGNDRVYAVRTDAAGDVYAYGLSETREFFQSASAPSLTGGLRGRRDVFVAKLTNDLRAVHWIVRLGGEEVELGAKPNELEQGRNTLHVDPDGTCYVSGGTNNPDFFDNDVGVVPVFDHVVRRQQQAGQPVLNPGNFDAFVARIASDGTVVWGTFLGGDGDESAYSGIARRGGALLVAGNVNEEDTLAPGQLWGQGGHPGEGLPGTDCSANPAGCRFQTSYQGGAHASGSPALGFHHIVGGDGFVARLRAADGTLVWTTYLGGSGFDELSGNRGLIVGPDGRLHLCGATRSADFPMPGGPVHPFDALHNASGATDGFVATLSRTGKALLHATYLGGEGNEQLSGLALDEAGYLVVTGYTDSGATDSSGAATEPYPTTGDAFQCRNYQTYQAGSQPPVTALVTRIAPALDALSFSSYLGGSTLGGGQPGPSTRDRGRTTAWDTGARLVLAGDTNSEDLASVHSSPPVGACPPLAQPIATGAAPYLDALDPTNLGTEEDCFLTRIRLPFESLR